MPQLDVVRESSEDEGPLCPVAGRLAIRRLRNPRSFGEVSVETGRGAPVIRCRLLSSQPIEPTDCDAVCQAIRQRLGKPIEVEFILVHGVR